MQAIKILRSVLSFTLLLNTIQMNAQQREKDATALDAHQQNLAAIAALTASGDTAALKTVLHSGLDAGLTINEIKEALVQLYAYCGFPRSLNALGAFKAVLDDRTAKGVKDKEGKTIEVMNTHPDKYEQGRKVLEELTKTPQPKPAPGFGEFAPRVDAFLKEHLFADIFNSDVLTFRQRELVTISALAAMRGVESQLKSHIGIGKNTGITDDQLKELCGIIEKHAGIEQSNVLRRSIGQPELPATASDMMVRISEIEIDAASLEQYRSILEEEAATSVKIEPGVIAIFPMFKKDDPTQVRIVEIYANRKAYEAHLQTPHFKLYKESTLKMVKSLKLIDMNALDTKSMTSIFEKIR
jgi:4-carboxymuconolactone decarboxylase